MTSTTATASVPLRREEAGRLFGQTMGLVALTAGLFALGAYIGRDLSGGWAICWFLVSFAALLGMNVAVQRSAQLAVGLLFGFGLVLGLAVAPAISEYVEADPQAVWLAGGATALIVFGIVLVLVEIPNGALIYAVAGLVIFAGLTLYDFQRLRQTEDIRTAPLLAASIFLDVLNVFLLFLSLFSRGE
jgi:modulator of FtsH protease